ncbi:hypothetical protein [Actinocorallia populi]|uniref:hypothetical protein n=1 Tax=Actinocorallia populi TaxID=2079200 RepID=UPI0013006A6B|nr:hypothetical protein [Actinocorallia populi]
MLSLAPGEWVVVFAALTQLLVPLVTGAVQVLAERARRTTLLAVIRKLPPGHMLVEERTDGSRLTMRGRR